MNRTARAAKHRAAAAHERAAAERLRTRLEDEYGEYIPKWDLSILARYEEIARDHEARAAALEIRTTDHARAILSDLLPDDGEPVDFPALAADIAKARREFTDEELTPAEHAARLAAARTLEAAARYTTEQLPHGTRYTFGDGTTLETRAADGTGHLTRRGPDGRHPIGFPVRHTGDVFHALRTGQPTPDHCKAY